MNPAHMEVVTLVENVQRGESPPAQFARATHCKAGHEFTPENIYSRPGTTYRECRECNRKKAIRQHRAQRGAVAERGRLLAENERLTHLLRQVRELVADDDLYVARTRHVRDLIETAGIDLGGMP